VGIGTSAGGLEALEGFLKHVPVNSGLAYIIVQHLDPTQKGMLPELLRWVTPMPIMEARSQIRVKPNCVYVIPPNKDLSILHGVLHLLDPVEPRGLRLPIDFFFRTLADDRHERSVGVILSGMGSDGTLGLQAIKEKAGLGVVQDCSEAKFDSMPRSAIAAGLADIVAPVEQLPQKIMDYWLQTTPSTDGLSEDNGPTHSALDKVVILLRRRIGRDFSLYKKSSVYRRIERRMGIHQIKNADVYIRYLRENPAELDLLFKELLIGVTTFFRDQQAWQRLEHEILPAMLDTQKSGGELRAWVAACSTGEEAYSLAITFAEVVRLSNLQGPHKLQIFATDLDPDAIEKARKGFYPPNIVSDVGSERLARYFIEQDNGYRVRADIREMVTFAQQDALLDPPFTRLDLLSCRNLLIYLGPEAQKKLIRLFHYSLRPGGLLFLGSAETIGHFNELFTPIYPKLRLYRRLDTDSRATTIDFPTGGRPITNIKEPMKTLHQSANLQSLADQFLLQKLSPAAVLINDQGDIIYISGRTGKYLEPAAGKANWNIYAMARDGLRGALTSAVHEALRARGEKVVHGINLETESGGQTFDLHVQVIDEPAELRGMLMISFADIATALPDKQVGARKSTRGVRLRELEQILQQTRAETANLREGMQITQEELRSANEELQSTNEELQSSNEELMTSKEEMQSMNEELQTVNAELQSKLEELMRAGSDMKNLLDSTDIATVFLDTTLNIRRFTSQATQVFKLIPGDVGRPLSDIVTDLEYADLHHDAHEVLRTLTFTEKLIHARDNRWFKVRIKPYRTLDNVIDGVVITFVNITEYQKLWSTLPKISPQS